MADVRYKPGSFIDVFPIEKGPDSSKHTDPRYHPGSAYFKGGSSDPIQPSEDVIKPVKPSSQENSA